MDDGRATWFRDALLTLFTFVRFGLIGKINVYRNKGMIQVNFQHLGMIKQFCSQGDLKKKRSLCCKLRPCSKQKHRFSFELSCANERFRPGAQAHTCSLSSHTENCIGLQFEKIGAYKLWMFLRSPKGSALEEWHKIQKINFNRRPN